MQTRRLYVAAFLLTVCALAASAQSPSGPGATAEPTVVIQMGYDLGYNVGTSRAGSAFDMSLMLTLTDALRAGVTFLHGDGTQFADYELLEFSYDVLPRLGALVSVGSATTLTPGPVAGIGIYSNVIVRNPVGSVQTGLRLLVDYLAPLGTGFNKGTVRLGIVAWLGV